MVGMSTAMTEASCGVVSNTLKPLTNAQTGDCRRYCNNFKDLTLFS